MSSFLRLNLKHVAQPYLAKYQVGESRSRYERGDKIKCILTALAVEAR